jgi:hypothetical protein
LVTVFSRNGYSLHVRDGHLRAWYFVNASTCVSDGNYGLDAGLIADGVWHHVAFVVDSFGGSLYVDGLLIVQKAWSNPAGAGPCTAT